MVLIGVSVCTNSLCGLNGISRAAADQTLMIIGRSTHPIIHNVINSLVCLHAL